MSADEDWLNTYHQNSASQEYALLIGYLVLRDLLGAQVQKALQSGNALERLKAVRRYGRSMGPEQPDFPPALPEVPPFRGPFLNDWVPEPGPGVEVLVP